MTIGKVEYISDIMNVSAGAIRNMAKMNGSSTSGIAGVIITATVDVGKRALESGTVELPGGGVPGTETRHLHLVPVETILTIANVIEKDSRLHLHARRHQYLIRSYSQQAHLMNRM